tara:strand:+ start:631 stop:954 length:324 start_codon:yes stop_codon:yes gene_type:complete
MKKPKTIKFGHRDFKIKYITQKEAGKRGIYGEVDTATNTIIVDKSLDHKVTINTLVHEILHVVSEHYHWNIPAPQEELIAETVGNALADVFNQNPKFVEYLAFAFKK